MADHLPTIRRHQAGGYCWTNCPDCGPDVQVDEDGCCATCGVDALFYGREDEVVCLDIEPFAHRIVDEVIEEWPEGAAALPEETLRAQVVRAVFALDDDAGRYCPACGIDLLEDDEEDDEEPAPPSWPPMRPPDEADADRWRDRREEPPPTQQRIRVWTASKHEGHREDIVWLDPEDWPAPTLPNEKEQFIHWRPLPVGPEGER